MSGIMSIHLSKASRRHLRCFLSILLPASLLVCGQPAWAESESDPQESTQDNVLRSTDKERSSPLESQTSETLPKEKPQETKQPNPARSPLFVTSNYSFQSGTNHASHSRLGYRNLKVQGGAPLFFKEKAFSFLSLSYSLTSPKSNDPRLDFVATFLHNLTLTSTFGFRLRSDLTLLLFGGAGMAGDYRRIDGHTFVPKAGVFTNWKSSDQWRFTFGLIHSSANLYYIPIPIFGFMYSSQDYPFSAGVGPPGGFNLMLRFVETTMIRTGVNVLSETWQVKAGMDRPQGLQALSLLEIQTGVTVYQQVVGPAWLGFHAGLTPYSLTRTTNNRRKVYNGIRRHPAPYLGLGIYYVP